MSEEGRRPEEGPGQVRVPEVPVADECCGTFFKFSDLTDFRGTRGKVLNGEAFVVPEGKVLLIEDVSVSIHTLPTLTEAVARLLIQRPGFNERHHIGPTDPLTGAAGRQASVVAAAGNRVSGEVRLLESREQLVRIITHLSGRLFDGEVVQAP